jgi:hypothetical protein
LVGCAGLEPATHGLLTTSAFTDRKIILRCSLDWLIVRRKSGLDVRRTVSEGFLYEVFYFGLENCLEIIPLSRHLNKSLKLNKELPADCPIFKIFTMELVLEALKGVPAYSRIFILLFPIKAPVSNNKSPLLYQLS